MLSITTPTHANLWQACPISVSRCVLFWLFSKWWRLTSMWFLMVARHIAWTWLAWQTPIATEARFAWSSSPRIASTGLRSCGLIRKSADPSGRAEPVWAELFQSFYLLRRRPAPSIIGFEKPCGDVHFDFCFGCFPSNVPTWQFFVSFFGWLSGPWKGSVTFN